jgi:tetratricopeptide (TPR) repeat protein
MKLRRMARNLFLIRGSLKKFRIPIAVILLIAATFVVYAPALRNGFVWDDTALVLRDPLIRSWRLIPESFGHFLFLDATASNFYRPLQRVTFTADYALYGFDAPWGWHLTSILIHAGAAVALFFLARRVPGPGAADERRRDGWAFAAALVWAVHPIYTSAVTYVAGRADPLAALFGFTGLALGMRSLQNPARRALATAAATLCFLAALLSKESGVAALLIWFVMLAWQRVPLRVFGKWLALGAAVLAVYLGLRLTAEKTEPPSPAPTSLAQRPVLAARAVGEYAGLIAAPLNLRMERDVSITARTAPEAARLRHAQTLLGAALIAALAFWAWRARRQQPHVALCILAFAVAYVPISNLFSLNATVAEHWLYVPGAFLLIAATASIGAWLASRGATLRIGAGAIFACWVLFLGMRTASQQAAWRDQRTFLETTIARGGDSARMFINLGHLESNAGHYDAARAHFRTALERAPNQPLAWFGVANVAIRTGDFPAAHAALEKAGASPLLKAEVLQARAVMAHRESGGDSGELLREAVAASPKSWAMRERWLEYLDGCGRTPEAVRELTALLDREPFRAASWRMLGRMLEKLGQPAEARIAYEEAAARDVRDASSRAKVLAFFRHEMTAGL